MSSEYIAKAKEIINQNKTAIEFTIGKNAVAVIVDELTAAEQKFAKLQAENEQYEKALIQIDNWAKAYPLKIFPKPDIQKAHLVLKEAGMTLDAISADIMRHVLDEIIDIIEQALKEN